MLPKPVTSSKKVTLSGGEVEVFPLTLDQSRQAGAGKGELDDAAIIAGISFATREDPRDVAEWLETAPAGDVTALLNAITEVSRLSGAAQFPERS